MTAETGGAMMVAAFILAALGGLLSTAGGIWLMVRAFHTSVGWGLAVLLLPIANLVYTVMHWKPARAPFLVSLLGVALMIAALVASASGGISLMQLAGAEENRVETRVTVSDVPEVGDEAGIPLTDREKVADLLLDAGIDPGNPRTFQGRTIEQMTQALGKPSAMLKTGRTTTFIFYNCFQVDSEDGGKTVAGVHYMGD